MGASREKRHADRLSQNCRGGEGTKIPLHFLVSVAAMAMHAAQMTVAFLTGLKDGGASCSMQVCILTVDDRLLIDYHC